MWNYRRTPELISTGASPWDRVHGVSATNQKKHLMPARRKSIMAEPIEGTERARELGQVTDQLCINTIRTLAMDAVQQANSGHPGTPMALAPVAYMLWQHFLRFDPNDPI